MKHRLGLSVEIDKLDDKLQVVEHPLARKDLARMLSHARILHNQLDRELVNCRRLGRYTNDYHKLEIETQEQIRQTGKWMTMALLKF
jgi:hypothetical protein